MNLLEQFLLRLYEAQPWRNHAACRGLDIDLFFPKQGGGALNSEARITCNGCAVRSECDADREAHGIWGGRTGRSRKPQLVKSTERKVRTIDAA